MRENKYNLSDEDFAKETELLELREKMRLEFGWRSKEYSKVNCSLYFLRNPSYVSQWHEKNKNYGSLYYLNNREEIRRSQREWRDDNIVRERKRVNLYKKKRKLVDPLFKFTMDVRKRVMSGFFMRGYSKNTKTYEILGAEFEFVLMYLIHTAEKRYGFYNEAVKYQIDHIVPISTATTQEEVIKLNHWTNLQFLTREDNLAKSDKVGVEAEAIVPFIDFKVQPVCPEGCGR